MSETVQESSGEPFEAKDIGPLVEGQVGSDEGGPALISLAEDLKEQFRPGLGQRDEAEFVDDQQL